MQNADAGCGVRFGISAFLIYSRADASSGGRLPRSSRLRTDRPAPVGLVRTLVSRRVRTRTPRRRDRLRRDARRRQLARADGAMVRRRLLGPGRLHDADVDDHRHRLRGRHVAAGVRGDPRMAAIPKTGRGAAAFVALFSMLASLVSWSFSLIFSGLLAREVTHRVRGADYRAVGAAAYLGVGSVWALGLSSSAALIMAAPASLPGRDRADQRRHSAQPDAGALAEPARLPRCSSSSRWPSATTRHPAPRRREAWRTWACVRARDAGRRAPGDAGRVARIQPVPDHRHLRARVRISGARSGGAGPAIVLDLNHYVFTFLIVGLLLHWRPRSFVRAIAAAVPPVGGVLIQYPLYAGIVKMMTESGLATQMAHFFVTISNEHTFPVMVGIYSAFLGLFIPSAGGKWLIEAPYMLEAAKSLDVHLGLGRADLQRHRGAGQPHSSVLDAAARRNPGIEGARHRRLLDAAVRGARAARAVPGVDSELHPVTSEVPPQSRIHRAPCYFACRFSFE